jgi:hypothetical protein
MASHQTRYRHGAKKNFIGLFSSWRGDHRDKIFLAG